MNMNDKKYTLSDEDTIVVKFGDREITLHRIIATEDIYRADGKFVTVKAGEKGGYVESRANLSDDGYCWLYGDSQAYGNARVTENAVLFDRTKIFGNAKASGCAQLWEKVKVSGNATVKGYVQLYGDTKIDENALVCDYAFVLNSIVYGNSQVCGKAIVRFSAVTHNAWVGDNAKIEGATIYGNATIRDEATVCENAKVHGDVDVCGKMIISQGMEVGNAKDDILS